MLLGTGDARRTALPYGWIGVIAAFQFGIWYYLGIEGTTQAAEEVRSPARSLPFGTMAGMITLLIAAALTWYVCASLLPWEYLGSPSTRSTTRRAMTGSALADVSPVLGHALLGRRLGQRLHQRCRARLVLARPRPLSADLVRRRASALPHALPLDPVPAADRARLRLHRRLNQAITFSILSGVLRLHLHEHQHHHVPQEVAARHDPARLRPSASIRCRRSCCCCSAWSPSSRSSSATGRSSSRW